MRLMLVFSAILCWQTAATAQSTENRAAGRCMVCHKEVSPGLYRQWRGSAHAEHGVNCLSCHQAQAGEPDAFEHYDTLIATLVTPRDCGVCHEREAEAVDASYHATAGLILESADAYLAHVGGGHPVAIAGCESCHGSKVEIDAKSPNRLAARSWPNAGIGRLNPDGSKGACNACHTRHAFSKAQARQPEACAKCHLGPDHPQKEIFEESKHGNAYYTHQAQMNLEADSWVVGVDYYAAPTCATCHMSATRSQSSTHDVGLRLKWTLRPPISLHKEDWEQKRANMQDVCEACHGAAFAAGHFQQFDAVVRLYDAKFARPAAEIMAMIKKKGLLPVKAAFGNDIEWYYWELWHHEGRRARHGAAMMGPDYTWWHGIYDVIHNFYFEFLPAAREFQDPEVNAYIDRLLAADPMHQWLNRSTPELKQAIRSGELQQIYSHLFNGE